ncbi:hypothetical protein GCM10022393_03500 [Aquimarina addita]|uniref:SnoaL-like domain-containing protein n=2 Tax=Aquimarina addita TaxID=870485 RepID=A0ABP7X946_9FLAO
MTIHTTETNTMDMQDEEKFIYLEVYGEGSHVEVRLNDIPVTTLKTNTTETGYGNSYTQAQYFVMPGINTLSVYPLTNKGKTFIRLVNFTKADGSTARDKGETLIKIEIDNNDTPVHKEVTLASDRKNWSWMEVDQINNKKDKEEARSFATSFYKTMVSGDIQNMIIAMDPILNYKITAKPETKKETLITEITKGLSMAFNDECIFDDINTISIDLVPIANGKLFLVKRKDGTTLFRTSDKSEFIVGFKDIIGRKNGVWQFYH